MHKYTPRKRTALDGVVWWCIFDESTRTYSTDIRRGKYKRKKDALYAIQKTEGLQ